jgi:hypothetical protein
VSLTGALGAAGVGVRALAPVGDSLERLFFELTEDQAAGVAE